MEQVVISWHAICDQLNGLPTGAGFNMSNGHISMQSIPYVCFCIAKVSARHEYFSHSERRYD